MSFFVPRRVSLLDGFGCCDGARDFLLKMSRMFRLFDRVTNSHLHVICDDMTHLMREDAINTVVHRAPRN